MIASDAATNGFARATAGLNLQSGAQVHVILCGSIPFLQASGVEIHA